MFIDPDPQCLAAALQSSSAQAALASFGRPHKHSMQKVNQQWYAAEWEDARPASRHLSVDPHGHAVNFKCHKQLLSRKRRAWERKAQQNLCEMASGTPPPPLPPPHLMAPEKREAKLKT